MPLRISVPAVVDLFPGHGKQQRVLFQDVLGMTHQGLALCRIRLTIALVHHHLEVVIGPFGVILRPILAVPFGAQTTCLLALSGGNDSLPERRGDTRHISSLE
jgi:hypothetical protein